jgi:hypothetical protein
MNNYELSDVINMEMCYYLDLENAQSININFSDGGTVTIHPDYMGALHDYYSNMVKEWIDEGNSFDTVNYATAEEIAEGEANE